MLRNFCRPNFSRKHFFNLLMGMMLISLGRNIFHTRTRQTDSLLSLLALVDGFLPIFPFSKGRVSFRALICVGVSGLNASQWIQRHPWLPISIFQGLSFFQSFDLCRHFSMNLSQWIKDIHSFCSWVDSQGPSRHHDTLQFDIPLVFHNMSMFCSLYHE